MMFLSFLLVFQFSGLSLSGDDRVPVPPTPVVVPSTVPTDPFPPMPPDEQKRVTIEPTVAPTPDPVPVPVPVKPVPVPKPVPRVASRPVPTPTPTKSPPTPAFELTWWPMRDYPGWEMHGRNAYGVIVDVDQFRWVGIPQSQVQMVQPMSAMPVMQANVWSTPAMSVSGFGFRSGFMSRFGLGFGSGSCAGGSCR